MSKFGTTFTSEGNESYLRIDDNDAFRLIGGKNTTVYSSGGVNTASSLANAYSAMTSEIFTIYGKKETGGVGGGRTEQSKAVLSELAGLSDDTSTQPVAYYWQGGFRTNSPTGHYIVLGVFFSDFKLQPIIPGDAGYTVSTDKESTDKTYTGGATNASSLSSSYSQGLEISITESASNSIQNTSSYTFGQSLSIASTVSAGINLEVLKANASVTTTLGVTFEQAFSTATTSTESVSKSTGFSSSSSLDLPAHTQVVLEQTEGEVLTTVEYDCPVALTYSVTCVVFTLDPDDNDGNALGAILVSFPNTGASYGAQSDFASRFPSTSANDADMIDWVKGIENLAVHREWTNKNNSAGDGDTDHESIMEPIQNNMGTSVNRPASPIYKVMNTMIPMSLTGGQYTYSTKGISTKIYDISPLYPLDTITPANGAYDYNMTTGEYFYVDNIELTGKNAQKVDYFGFNKDNGYWTLIDINGNEADPEVAELKTDRVTQNTRLVAGSTEGTVYLKYIIDDHAYTYYNSSMEDIVYTTNEDISKTATIKVNVSREPFDGTIKISSDSTIEGYVNDSAINLDAVEGLTVRIQGSDEVYYDRPVIWQAQEPVSSGIAIVDNQMTFTKTGTFLIRARIANRYKGTKRKPERAANNKNDMFSD